MYPFRQANVPLGIHVPQVGTPWVICFGKRHPNKASFAYIKCYHAWTQTSIGQNGGITLNFELWENFLPSWWFLRCQACMEARRRQALNGGCTSNEWSRRWSFPTVVLWRKSMGCFLIHFCSTIASRDSVKLHLKQWRRHSSQRSNSSERQRFRNMYFYVDNTLPRVFQWTNREKLRSE